MSATMTRGERTDLATLVRQRERLLKTLAAQRSAELMADVEAQLARIYDFDEDDTWAAASEVAEEAMKEAQAEIAERCQELGIPPEFAPGLSMGWYDRGSNACSKRRTELRRVAKSRIEATERAAKTAIEQWSLDARTELIAPSLTSDAAKEFLEQLPLVQSLMPKLDAVALLGKGK